MRILFIGDIFGRAGREALEKYLPTLKEKLEPDVVIVNGENAANGNGITEKIAKEFYEWGTDVITTGNHVWDQREILSYIERDPNLIRPANYPAAAPGRGFVKFKTEQGQTILVINMMARLFMDSLDDPFRVTDELLKGETLGNSVDAIFIDFHGEATSEKMAYAHYLDGRVSGIIGTHTHIPTADAHVLGGGTAYMTDAGMTGVYDSVIGVEKSIPIHRFTKKTPSERMRPAMGEAMLCGALIVTNAKGLAQSIEPVRIGHGLSETMPEA